MDCRASLRWLAMTGGMTGRRRRRRLVLWSLSIPFPNAAFAAAFV